MKYNWSFEQNIVFRNDVEFLKLESNIKTLLVFQNFLILLLNNTTLLSDRNIFCYDLSGKLLWQIPLPIKIDHDENHFTGLCQRDNKIFAYNINGVEYLINIENGDFIHSELIR